MSESAMAEPMRQAQQQLAGFRGLGDDAAQSLLRECMAEAGLSAIDSPDDLMKVARRLIERGGLIEVIGRSLKVTAIRIIIHERT